MKRSFYRKWAFIFIKWSIVIGALYFIYHQIEIKSATVSNFFYIPIFKGIASHKFLFIIILFFSVFNWFFEIKKWQVLVRNYQEISFQTAMIQSLAAHTVSLLTPYKTGEYAGRAAFYTKKMRKKIFGLTFFSNTAQLVATLILGGSAFVLFIYYFDVDIPFYRLRKLAYVLAFGFMFLLAGYKAYGKRFGWQRFVGFFKKLNRRSGIKVLLLSILRFVIFSHQFYLLLLFFNISIDYQKALILIGSVYFISAIVPVISLFDFAIKGSIAIYVFSFIQVDAFVLVSITFLMWLFNFVFPALWGSIYVLKFKLPYASTQAIE